MLLSDSVSALALLQKLKGSVCEVMSVMGRQRRAHLGQVLPQLTQVVKHLGVDLGVFDGVHVAQDTQHPPPHHRGHVRVPAGQRATGHHAAVLIGKLARF